MVRTPQNLWAAAHKFPKDPSPKASQPKGDVVVACARWHAPRPTQQCPNRPQRAVQNGGQSCEGRLFPLPTTPCVLKPKLRPRKAGEVAHKVKPPKRPKVSFLVLLGKFCQKLQKKSNQKSARRKNDLLVGVPCTPLGSVRTPLGSRKGGGMDTPT